MGVNLFNFVLSDKGEEKKKKQQVFYLACVFVMTHFKKILGEKTHLAFTSRKFPFHGNENPGSHALRSGERVMWGSGSAFLP